MKEEGNTRGGIVKESRHLTEEVQILGGLRRSGRRERQTFFGPKWGSHLLLSPSHTHFSRFEQPTTHSCARRQHGTRSARYRSSDAQNVFVKYSNISRAGARTNVRLAKGNILRARVCGMYDKCAWRDMFIVTICKYV